MSLHVLSLAFEGVVEEKHVLGISSSFILSLQYVAEGIFFFPHPKQDLGVS